MNPVQTDGFGFFGLCAIHRLAIHKRFIVFDIYVYTTAKNSSIASSYESQARIAISRLPYISHNITKNNVIYIHELDLPVVYRPIQM